MTGFILGAENTAVNITDKIFLEAFFNFRYIFRHIC